MAKTGVHSEQIEHISELLTPAQAAIELRVSASSIKRWAKDGRLDHVVLPNGQIRIPYGAMPRLKRARLQHSHNDSDRRP